MRKLLFTLCVCLAFATQSMAQQQVTNQRLISAGNVFFVPHWFVTLQGGGAYDVGEAKFSKLVSPALQASLGYQYNPYLATRLSVSGWQARNCYAYPYAEYKWNFIQPAADVLADLTTLIGGWNPDRSFHVWAFAGLGVALSFNNDDALEADKRYGIDFQKIWDGSRWNPVVRGGLGADIVLTDNISVGAEVNANMLPDHFNSKLGKRDNRDWHFNALVGIKYTIGRSYGHTEPIYQTIVETVPQPEPKPEPKVEPKPEPKPEFVDVPVEKISFNVNIHFVINQSVIRANQVPKLQRLLQYLHEHPKAFIRLSGYADKDTGTPEINMRLSIERSQVVSQYLQDAGIEEWRIRRFAKGDRVQPFDIPQDNRVCICFVYDPDNPVPQAFSY